MTSSKLHFEEPPMRGRGYRHGGAKKYRRIAAQLKARPSEWAIIATRKTPASSNSLAYQIRRGTSTAFLPKGDFEAISRQVGTEHRVYARYVGAGSP